MIIKTVQDAQRAIERLCKFRGVFAGWQLGTREKSDPECQAVRDHRELTLMLRIEVNALAQLLVEKGVFANEEFTLQMGREAVCLTEALEKRFPGFTATDNGLVLDVSKVQETMRGWRP